MLISVQCKGAIQSNDRNGRKSSYREDRYTATAGVYTTRDLLNADHARSLIRDVVVYVPTPSSCVLVNTDGQKWNGSVGEWNGVVCKVSYG